MAQKYSDLWRTTRDYFFITFGMALYAFGFCAFILPEKVVIGGLAGIGTIVYLTTGIPVAITQYACNLFLLALAYRMVGKKFVLGTIYGATMISVFVGIFQPIFQNGFTQEPFMNIVVGALLAGLGVGIAFTHNGSSGGTDIIAAIVSKFSTISVGRTMQYTDIIIISSSYLLFHNVERTVFGYIVLLISSTTADWVINSNRSSVQFTIFSKKWQEIATAINNDARRGCTVLNGMGWYSKEDVKVLLVVCRRVESITISRIIKSIDSDAFITQANVSGVFGKGFDELKVKMKTPATDSHLASHLPKALHLQRPTQPQE